MQELSLVSNDEHFDPSVVAAAVAGDRRAAHALLVAFLPRARNLVRYLLRGDRDVDDIAQDALIAVARGLATYRAEGTFTAWADRIVARTTFAALRARRGREAPIEDIASPDAPELASDDGDPHEYLVRRRAVAMLDHLPEEQRHALVLHHVLEMSVPEAALALGIPAETFRSRLRLGRARLRMLEEAREPTMHGEMLVEIGACR